MESFDNGMLALGQTGVGYVKRELKNWLTIYEKINDCILGEREIKSKTVKYLPKPNPSDKSEENNDRYSAYVERAVFYNACESTLEGLTGQVFYREPIVKVPESLNTIVEDATGENTSLNQFAKETENNVLAFSRSGILIDYPYNEEGDVSIEIVNKGEARATLTSYLPWNIINWRTVERGSETVLSLVVLREKYYEYKDFEEEELLRYRVLKLDEMGKVTVEFWNVRDGMKAPSSVFEPRDFNGKRLDSIPFLFVGAQTNNSDIDKPLMYDLSVLNISHYRNSADYEESSYIVGQPTPYFTGLSENWVDRVLKNEIRLGSRGGIPLPVNATAGLLQAAANAMPKEAMDQKERQMVALGAKLVEQKTVQRTATEASLENISEISKLASATNNVSAAITKALEWCLVYQGGEGSEVEYSLNTDFDLNGLNPQEQAVVIQSWQQGAISFTEMRTNLKKAGVATQDDNEAKEEIEEEQAQKPPIVGIPENG